jgi:L-ribulokinase
MKTNRYLYGYDFGTQSCRLVVVSAVDGETVAQAEMEYPHGVISEHLPGTDIELKGNWYLQDPEDYITVLTALSKEVLSKAKIAPEDVLAIGTAFTNCTMMPIDNNGNVLCTLDRYRNNPHSWVKLWKHHGAEIYAKEIEAYAKKNFPRLKNYGDSVSSEWLFPKILQVLREARGLYDATYAFIEAADWIVYKLCGNLVRNTATLGVNAFYDDDEGGYPPKEFFAGIDSAFENVVEEKLKGPVAKVGERAGTLTEEMAELMGLTTNTIVAVGHGDSEVAACGAGIVTAGSMIMVMGTSICHQMMSNKKKAFKGVCAVVKDGMVPGFYAYESGQPAAGDILEWYADNLVTECYRKEAEEKGITLFSLLDQKAAKLKPGESGLIALDWFNGNRSILMDYDLTGLIMGLTLKTKPEEIFRALIEATAFGTRVILDTYEDNQMEIKEIIAVGGLPRNSPFVSQLYADILGRKVIVPLISNITALGAAVCAGVAAGSKNGGFKDFDEAAQRIAPKEKMLYMPDKNNVRIYNKLYKVYKTLHDYFGDARISPMKEIQAVRQDIN